MLDLAPAKNAGKLKRCSKGGGVRSYRIIVQGRWTLLNSTVVTAGGAIDDATGRLTAALDAPVLIDLPERSTAGRWAARGAAGGATGRAVGDGSRRARETRGSLDDLVAVWRHGARANVAGSAGDHLVGAVVADGCSGLDGLDWLDDDGALAGAQTVLDGDEEAADGEGFVGNVDAGGLAALEVD